MKNLYVLAKLSCRLWLASATLLLTASAAAGAPTEIDRATAQKLFDDAIELMNRQQYQDACSKLEASQRLDPAMGTQFNLADCFEKTGRIAAAWVNFTEVADAALKTGATEREQVARERARQAASKLSFVTIRVKSPSAGMTVKRDDSEIGQSLWGTAMPIDAGKHVIVASAPGRLDWSKSISIAGERATVEVVVPALAVAPAMAQKRQSITVPMSSGPADQVNSSGSSSSKTWALVSAGLGVVGLGVGTAMVAVAEKKHSEAAPYCPNGKDCNDTRGTDALASAKRLGDWANVPFGIGIAGLGLGTVLWLTARSSKGDVPRTSVGVSPSGVLVNGRF
jgi:hypothetical protein